jgi:hypothetical protein
MYSVSRVAVPATAAFVASAVSTAHAAVPAAFTTLETDATSMIGSVESLGITAGMTAAVLATVFIVVSLIRRSR